MSTGVILVLSGIICLGVCGFMFYKLMPQEGKPPSAWTGTDMRGTAVAMTLLLLLLSGLGLLAKGFGA